MRILILVAMVVGCGGEQAAAPDAPPADAAPDANIDPALLVPCDANWNGVRDAPFPGVMCAAACADHFAIGKAQPCAKARTVQYDGFQCTAATATAWGDAIGCCLVQPEFAHVQSEPVVFAVCD